MTERTCQYNLDTVTANLEPWDKEISLIVQANGDLRLAQLNLHRRVRSARRGGHSWAAIGYALGISRQAAQQRFGGGEERDG
jgi:hypothetical protein